LGPKASVSRIEHITCDEQGIYLLVDAQFNNSGKCIEGGFPENLGYFGRDPFQSLERAI
jgi:hypothetical protein